MGGALPPHRSRPPGAASHWPFTRRRAGRFVTSRSAVGRSRFVRGSGGRSAEPRDRHRHRHYLSASPPLSLAAPLHGGLTGKVSLPPPGVCALRGGGAGGTSRAGAAGRARSERALTAPVSSRRGRGGVGPVPSSPPPPTPRACCLFPHHRIKIRGWCLLPLAPL